MGQDKRWEATVFGRTKIFDGAAGLADHKVINGVI